MASAIKVPRLPEPIKVAIFCKGLHPVLQFRSMHDPVTFLSFTNLDQAMTAAQNDERQRVHEFIHRKTMLGINTTNMTDADRVRAFYQAPRAHGGANSTRGNEANLSGRGGRFNARSARGARGARGGRGTYLGFAQDAYSARGAKVA